MNKEKPIYTNTQNGEPITQSDIDKWCNCSNFPFEKCNECKAILRPIKENL